jgi:hypothetical protein
MFAVWDKICRHGAIKEDFRARCFEGRESAAILGAGRQGELRVSTGGRVNAEDRRGK